MARRGKFKGKSRRRGGGRRYKRDAKGRFARTGTRAKKFAKKHKRGLMIAGGVAVGAGAAYGSRRLLFAKKQPGLHPLFLRQGHMVYRRESQSLLHPTMKGYRPVYSLKTNRRVTGHTAHFLYNRNLVRGGRGFSKVPRKSILTKMSGELEANFRHVRPGSKNVYFHLRPGYKNRTMGAKAFKARASYESWLRSQGRTYSKRSQMGRIKKQVSIQRRAHNYVRYYQGRATYRKAIRQQFHVKNWRQYKRNRLGRYYRR